MLFSPVMYRVILTFSFLFMLVAGPMSGAAFAQARLALVIGNGDYPTAPLKNPPNDARAVEAALLETGFTVTRLLNGSEQEMKEAVRQFGRDLRRAGEDAVAVFYFAGHGVQLNGSNYLIPANANIDSAADVEFGAVEAQWILDLLGESKTALSIIILDACRNNPFRSIARSTDRGLARMDAPRGSILAYSTAPGDVALDGTGTNSPYTEALAAAIRKPGLKVEEMFKEVRRQVLVTTGDRQVPWESSSLVGDFYFAGLGDTSAQPVPVYPAPPAIEVKLPGTKFRDCPDCPEMVVVPSGTLKMGSRRDEDPHESVELPETEIPIDSYALGVTEVTKDAFEQFINETGYNAWDGCWYWSIVWIPDTSIDWRDPGYEQTGSHPVVCANFDDMRAYVDWLSRKAGKLYRLPSEAEWEFAAEAGEPGLPWAGDEDQICAHGNMHDVAGRAAFTSVLSSFDCDDKAGQTAPVKSYQPNAYGLYDMIGNVNELVDDCWNSDHEDRPDTARARRDGDCSKRVLKGTNFANYKETARPAWRMDMVGIWPNIYTGFRVARDLD